MFWFKFYRLSRKVTYVTPYYSIILRIKDPIMNPQSKISSFFKPLKEKSHNMQDASPPAKRQKLVNHCDKNKSEESANAGVENQQLSPSSGKAESKTSPVASLSPEQKAKMQCNKRQAVMKKTCKDTNGLVVNVGESWFFALQEEFTKPYFLQLSKFVAEERQKFTIYPPTDEVFSFTKMCPITQVKVVILGQDPYHGPRQAHGLCFSVQKGVPPPPSLQNMYKTLSTDIEGFTHPGHGYLAGWAEQGVLLLNAVLTVKAHNANSHKDKGWEKFTDAVITYINKNMDGVVFMLWGAYAQKKGACIDQKRHHVLKGVHPSPLSAHRGFFDCQHFSKCNAYLEKQHKQPIDWKNLPLP